MTCALDRHDARRPCAARRSCSRCRCCWRRRGCAASAPGSRRARIVSLVPARHRDAVRDRRRTAGRRRRAATTSTRPRCKRLPRVGALLDPDIERILVAAARPGDRLRHQTDLQQQLERAPIPDLRLPPRRARRHHRRRSARSATAPATPSRRTRSVGHRERALADIRRAHRRPRRGRATLLVFGREPARCATSTRAAGAASSTTCSRPPAAPTSSPTSQRESVQATTELILARAPEVIIELRATDSPVDAAARARPRSGTRLSSVPAVRNHRVHRPRPARTRRARARASPSAPSAGARAAPGGVQMKILVSWRSGKDSAWMLHVLPSSIRRRLGGC